MVKYLEVGQIVNTFGVKGEVKVKPFTDDIKRFDDLKKIYIENSNNQMQLQEIEYVKYSNNVVILKIKNIDNMEQAEKLKGSYLKIDRKNAIKLPKDTYFIADLIGLDVFADNNVLLGKIEDIYNAGSSDIYVVKNNIGKQILLPAIPDVIKQINLDEEKIIVHLIDGLID